MSDRRHQARDQWWQSREEPLLLALAEGGDYGAILAQQGVTTSAVTHRRARDEAFATRLDAALIAGRDPGLAHGTGAAWKARCRCPECRAHHESSR